MSVSTFNAVPSLLLRLSFVTKRVPYFVHLTSTPFLQFIKVLFKHIWITIILGFLVSFFYILFCTFCCRRIQGIIYL
uniref:Uncharacterized protein n=1 Tax=Lotus japonicus TaxID=34305 RepID=I3SRT7_LOTJA|nr:unknown [Lotus japonicus]